MDFAYCALILAFTATMVGFVALCVRVEKKP